MITKVCKLCKKDQDISNFNKHNETKDRLDQRCRKCLKKDQTISMEKRKNQETICLDIHETKVLSTEWQGGKYVGTIFKRNNENTYTVNVKGKYKTFNPVKLGGDSKASDKALKWRNMMSDKLLLTRNKYKIIHDNTNNPLYIILQTSDNYVTLCDFNDIFIIKNYYFYARCSSKTYAKTYVGLQVKDKLRSFHKFKTGYDMTDHINRYSLDNRDENFQKTNASENNKNKTKIKFRTVQKQYDGTYIATIAYTENNGIGFTKACKSITTNTRTHANNWIEKECRIIDGIDQLEQTQQKLITDFETIMKKHADGFKWQDNDKDTNKTKDISIKKEKKTIDISTSIVNKKTDIFKKFHLIDPTYDYKSDLTSGGKIDHIKNNNKEYKFCSKCDTWKLIVDFFNAKKNYDNLDRQCKVCKKAGSKNANLQWKINNKERISAYNKAYRENNVT